MYSAVSMSIFGTSVDARFPVSILLYLSVPIVMLVLYVVKESSFTYPTIVRLVKIICFTPDLEVEADEDLDNSAGGIYTGPSRVHPLETGGVYTGSRSIELDNSIGGIYTGSRPLELGGVYTGSRSLELDNSIRGIYTGSRPLKLGGVYTGSRSIELDNSIGEIYTGPRPIELGGVYTGPCRSSVYPEIDI